MIFPQTASLRDSARTRYVFFFLVYVFQGLPEGFSLTTLALYLAHHGMQPRELGEMAAWIGLPWGIKFLWGPFMDSVTQLRFGRRRVPIAILMVLAATCLTGLLEISDPLRQAPALIVIFSMHALFASILDNVVDGTAVEVLPPDQRGRGSASMMVGRIFGWALGSAGLSTILAGHGFYPAALALVIATSSLCLLPLLVPDGLARPQERRSPLDVLTKTMLAIATKQSLLLIAIVSLVDCAVSVARRAVEYSFVHDYGWRPEQLAVLKGIGGALVSVAVITAVGWLVDRKGPRVTATRAVLALIAVYSILIFQPFAWSDWHVLAGYNIFDLTLAPAFGAAMAPFFMAVCKPEVEGSQYATYQSLFNVSDIAGASLFGHLMGPFGARPLVLGCCATLVLAYVLLTRFYPGSAARPDPVPGTSELPAA